MLTGKLPVVRVQGSFVLIMIKGNYIPIPAFVKP